MTYICPMHPEIRQDHPGTCPICGMKLVFEHEAKKTVPQKNKTGFFKTYQPLIVIVGMILLVATVTTVHTHGTLQDGMLRFMAGFFLVFSGLKLLDVPGFAKGYAMYDLLAKHVNIYGYIYPFLELTLGLLYLTRINLPATNAATLILMLFSGIGVTMNVLKGKKVQCACLGTMIKVPLTNVTIVEDFGMALMAGVMLLS